MSTGGLDAVVRPDPTVFLTGATGLLGHILALALLERGFDLILLARGTRRMSAQERIDRLMLEAFPSWDAYAPVRRRIRVVEGDVRQELLGLSPDNYFEIVQSISHIVHCAALLDFLPEQREAVYESNLPGALHAHTLARDAGLPTMHYVSTAYVVGAVPGGPGSSPCLEVPIVGTPRFNNAYEESKCRAEQLIGEMDARCGVRTTIYRPSCILGEYATGRTITFRTLYGFIDLIDQERMRLKREGIDPATKRLVYFGDIPRETTRNVVPVDYVAAVMAYIIDTPRAHGRIYHLVNPEPTDRWESNRAMTTAVGFRDLVKPSDRGRYPEDELVSFQPGRLARFNRVFSGYLLDHEPRFDDRNTREVLASSGISLPALDEAWIERVVRYCLDTRWRTDVEREVSAKLAASPGAPDGEAS